jgi:hypothetical protein
VGHPFAPHTSRGYEVLDIPPPVALFYAKRSSVGTIDEFRILAATTNGTKGLRASLRTLLLLSLSSFLSGCYGACGLTDEDLIEKAIEFYLADRQPGIDGYYESDGFRYRRYESYAEFIAINPDCCRVEMLLPEWGTVPFRHTLWYGYRGTVYINSLHQRVENGSIVLEDDDSHRSSPYDLVVPISRCGKPIMSLVEN